MSEPKHDRNLDDFWNVEELLPQKSGRRPKPLPRPTPEAVELELPQSHGSLQTDQTAPASSAPDSTPISSVPLTVSREESSFSNAPHASVGEGESVPLLDYAPEGALLHRVKVYDWQSGYHYFDQFADDAVRFAAMKPPKEARPETFFSYFPQYVQLSRRATAWYLYWREGVRREVYMDTDYAYVLLYLFELINLPAEEPTTARAHRDLMAKVWMAYRRSYHQLDHYMCEWLCDYCLIHGLAAPVDLLSPALDEIIMESRLKEFYLSAAVRVPENGAPDTALETARILMRHCCQYDYRKSKFASGEHRDLFDKTIPSAVAAVIPMLLGAGGRKPAITMLESTMTRDAYTGALCSYRNKRRIEIAYMSFSRSHELRFLVGDMVKHVENRIRGWIGVRSRLTVMSLPTPLRDALDEFLAPLTPPKHTTAVQKREAERPAYEALYDLPSKPVSLADAAAIEASSWETTRILVEAFGDTDTAATAEARPEPAPRKTVSPVPDTSEQIQPTPASLLPDAPMGEGTDGGLTNLLSPYRDFLRAALAADGAAQKKAAEKARKMPDAIADEINAITAESDIGDIVLEEISSATYAVIDDYRDILIASVM